MFNWCAFDESFEMGIVYACVNLPGTHPAHPTEIHTASFPKHFHGLQGPAGAQPTSACGSILRDSSKVNK